MVANKSFQLLKKTILTVAEGASLLFLVYWSLPVPHELSLREARALITRTDLKDVYFSPYLCCRGADARHSGRNVQVNLVWETLQEQILSYFYTVEALDRSGLVLNTINYNPDGRKKHIGKGFFWFDNLEILDGNSDIAAVAITIVRDKKELLVPRNLHGVILKNQKLIIPVKTGKNVCPN